MTELARRPAGALAVDSGQRDWTPDQRDWLDNEGLSGAPRGVMLAYLTTCQQTGLNPFAKQIYLIGRDVNEIVGHRADGKPEWRKRRKFSTQVGIDGFRVIAQRSGKYLGRIPTEWCGSDGVWRDVWLSADPPAAARVGVRHADWPDPLVAVAIFDEYAPRNRDGKLTGQWPKMPALMVAKVAEALAMRQAFPQDLSGIYAPEEMDQAAARLTAPTTVPRIPSEVLADVVRANTRGELEALWNETGNAGTIDQDATDPATGEVQTLRAWMTARAAQIVAATQTPGAGEPQSGPDADGSGTVRPDPAPGPAGDEDAGAGVDANTPAPAPVISAEPDATPQSDPDPWETQAPGAQF